MEAEEVAAPPAPAGEDGDDIDDETPQAYIKKVGKWVTIGLHLRL